MDRAKFYPWYVVVVLLLINALSYLDRQVMSILVIPIQRDLGFSDSQMGILMGPAFMALFVLAGMPMGRIADKSHRGVLLATGIVIWSAGTSATALAGSFAAMACGRAAVGLGEACVVPAAYSLVADYFAPDRRGRATAWVTIGIPIGAAGALMIGGYLLRLFGSGFAGDWPLVQSHAPWSLVLLAFGAAGAIVALLALTIAEPRRLRASDAPVQAEPVGGFAAFLRHDAWPITVVLLPYVLLTFIQVAMIVWVPTLLTRRQGLDPADAAILYGALTFAIPVVATLSGGWIADRLLKRYAAGPFLLVTWLTPALFPGVLLFALPHSLPLVVLGLSITLAVGGVCNTTVYAAVQPIAPVALRGRMLALYGLTAQLAGVGFGPLVVGFISDHVLGDRALLHLAIIVAIAPAWLVALGCGIIGRRHYAELRAKANPSLA